MHKWPNAPFSSIFAVPVRNGIYKPKEFHGRGVKIVNMGELFAHSRLMPCDMKRVELDPTELDRFSLAPKDLIFARRSLTAEGAGKCSIIMDVDEDTTFESSIIRARLDENRADPHFYFYLFQSPLGYHLLDTIRRQVAVAGITGSDLSALKVPVPSLSEQHAISSVLSVFDDKIDLNRRMNETLEAMARTIFEDWFVDFGPVRAKMEGRDPPGLAPEIAALFPDRLGEDGLPEGWTSAPLDEIASFLNGIALQKWPAEGVAFLPVIKIAQLRAGTSAGSDTASTSIPQQYLVRDGDVLFSWSGSLMHRVWTAGEGALNQHLFKVTSNTVPKWFYYHWIGFHMPAFQAVAASKATTMGHIQRHHLTQAVAYVATAGVMKVADALIGPLFEKVIANDLESKTLGSLRDLILPKLMSGELRVSDAEKLMGQAA